MDDRMYGFLVEKPLRWFLSRFSGQVDLVQREKLIYEVKALVFSYIWGAARVNDGK